MAIEALMPFPLGLEEAQGDEIELKIGEPFASFWRAQRERLYYSAVMSNHPGSVAATVKDTDKPVSAIASIGKGRVILVPTIWWPDVRDDEEDDENDGTVTLRERGAPWTKSSRTLFCSLPLSFAPKPGTMRCRSALNSTFRVRLTSGPRTPGASGPAGPTTGGARRAPGRHEAAG